MKNRFFAFCGQNIHLLLLGTAGALSTGALCATFGFDAARLNAFGPTAKLYFDGVKNGLTVSTFILVFSFFAAALFGRQIKNAAGDFKEFFEMRSGWTKNIAVLILCLVFAFVSQAGNIVNGYFNQDDFMVIAVNRTTPFVQSLFVPHGNDHTMPLFMAEMRGLDFLFGQNPAPYNFFIFFLFALIPFFTWLSFKKIGVGFPSFVIFLALFAGAAGWTGIVPGFYIMSVYPQSFFFFSVMLWSYLAWLQNRKRKYMVFFALALACTLAIDISGLWVIPTMGIVFLCRYWLRGETFAPSKKEILPFLKENRIPLAVFAEIIIIFSIFLVYVFGIVQPNTFLSALNGDGLAVTGESKAENWRLLPLAENYFSLFASGVSLSLIAPKIQVLLSHPALKNGAEKIWPLLEMFVLFINGILVWLALEYAKVKEKKFFAALFGIMSAAIFMVILARPDHSPIPNFDYRYAGAAFYMYCLALATAAGIFLREKKELAAKILIPAVIIIFSAQQAMSFETLRTNEESKMRREALVRLDKTLLSELDGLSAKKTDGKLIIPNLSGANIFPKTMAGFPLSYFILFFNRGENIQLIQSPEIQQDGGTRIVLSVPNLRTSVSPEFIAALKTSETLRSYYFSPGLVSYKVLSESANPEISKWHIGEIVVRKKSFVPEKIHALSFTLATDDVSGNLEIPILFENDFGWKEPAGKIRVDDFTSSEIKNGKRIYRIETGLLQLPAYALSEKISNLVLAVPETKNAAVGDISLR